MKKQEMERISEKLISKRRLVWGAMDDREKGAMEKTLTLTVSYREGVRTNRKSQAHQFSVRLNPDQVVRRVPAHLVNILGLTPKSMRHG